MRKGEISNNEQKSSRTTNNMTTNTSNNQQLGWFWLKIINIINFKNKPNRHYRINCRSKISQKNSPAFLQLAWSARFQQCWVLILKLIGTTRSVNVSTLSDSICRRVLLASLVKILSQHSHQIQLHTSNSTLPATHSRSIATCVRQNSVPPTPKSGNPDNTGQYLNTCQSTTAQWKEAWLSASVVKQTIVTDITSWQPKIFRHYY